MLKETLYNYSPLGSTEVIGEASPNPFMFTGREWDEDTGMYFYRARYYSPVMKRFISEDPIGYSAGDVNFYRYVGNQPLDWSDPLGFTTWPTNHCVVTSPFDLNRTINGRTRPHTAIDIRNPSTEPVFATDSGTVIEIGYDGESGNYIKIRLGSGDIISYSHTNPNVAENDFVLEGQVIGNSDGSGLGDPHLHFVYRDCSNGTCTRVDPSTYLRGATMPGSSQECNP